jgi:acyl-coenzyme A thioesterase PaaI-like protein
MAQTWNTDNMIRELISFYRTPSASKRGELRQFYTIGHGLNAHAQLLHGGVIATILDSALSNVVGQDRGTSSVCTAQFNVAYRAPVKTPGTIMARS